MDELYEFRIPEEAIAKMQDPEFVRKQIIEGKPLQEVIGYSDEVMERMYQAAKRLLDQHFVKEAKDAFLFLTTVNPKVFAFWLGLGMSYQLCEEYEHALVSYRIAVKLNITSPIPEYYAGCCHLLLNELEHAEQLLKNANAKANDDEWTDIKQRIAHAIASIKKKRGIE